MAGLRKKQRLALIAASGLCLAAATALFGFAFRDGIAYFRSPAEVYEDAPSPEELFRVGGLVVEGSLERKADSTVIFAVTDGEASVDIRFKGILPDLFAEGQGVIALGRFSGKLFNATEILAKHDETYMPKEVADALKERGLFKPKAQE
ncbi:MAG: cytochrome c maturation protein CcmE [Albidovulum sp.]|nr:cytochrome c maturation protein CcmE [Albidovulum sp.]MDE0305526.1 cytochrome c maturation protein CcmE [Albidovulum sp.]MDE0533429.1 cytochrome c maturation protein CcmE [Albidovulum sp.]